MEELHKIVKKKYKEFDITSQHLGQVIRDNNIIRKRTRHEHYPKERYGKPTDIKKELKAFYMPRALMPEQLKELALVKKYLNIHQIK